MQVVNKKMYHLIKDNKFSHLWQEGSIIDNTKDNFTNDRTIANFDYATIEEFDDEYQPFYEIINYFIENKPDRETMEILLEHAQRHIHLLQINQMELALEEVRRQFYPGIVSRRQAIWVCDENQIEYWDNELPGQKNLFEVAITGDMFKTSSAFLPPLGLSYNDSLKQAHEYWHPDFHKCDPKTIEYLVKGKIKVLKKV